MRRLEGKSIEEIVDAYAKEKGVDPSDVTYTVVDERRSLLGIGGKVSADVFCSKDIEEFLHSYVAKFFEGLGIDIDVEIDKQDDGLYLVELNAENNAMLIGRGGQTLQAFNTVVKGAAANQFKKRIPLLVDINGYKEERYEHLEMMAYDVAREVERTRQSAVLDPMPADERKVIHQYLNSMEHVDTISEGEGRDRCVRIFYVESKERPKEEEE